MSTITRNPIEKLLIKHRLRKQEQVAGNIPYVSFLLTHLALVLFICALWVIDRVIADTTGRAVFKIALVTIAVVSLASEWLYAIMMSRRWKEGIRVLQQVEEQQQQEEEARHHQQEQAIILQEQQKNLTLRFDLQQRKRAKKISAPVASPIAPDLEEIHVYRRAGLPPPALH